jgi:DNA repair protein RecN (Recombination protein N)
VLRKLLIQNYAIINEINIDFSGKLNIITGETGAGKSILMGALSLILGERADSSVLVNKQQKCFIEGYFSTDQKPAVVAFLKENDLDTEEELILRREIGSNGKSRAFINDSPASLIQLKQLAGLLVDLHQQFDTLELGESDFQRQVIDALAGNEEPIQLFKASFFKWQTITKELAHLKTEKNNFVKEADYHQFLFDEIDQLNLSENELEDLEEELKLLSNAENIKSSLDSINAALNDADQPIVVQLKSLYQQLVPFQEYNKSIPALCNRLKSAQVELQDIADELAQINNHIHFDEKRIEWISLRLNDGFKLIKKHGVKTTPELIAIKNDLAKKLEQVLHLDDSIIGLEKEAAEILVLAELQAKKISASRSKIIPDFEKKVNSLLKQVGMPNANIQVKLTPTNLYEFGLENVAILFDANNTNKFESIKKVASGGELSRLMLSIKSLVAEYINLPTLIFDEIDTGISGEAAKQVGLIMKKMADQRQIICITHQPQIAGKADAHFYVYKAMEKEQMQTTIKLLEQEERIDAIAKMLSGEKPTPAALENAREMIFG